MTIQVTTITAPSRWASYLVNGDASGMEDDERKLCDIWLGVQLFDGWRIVSCDGEEYCSRAYPLTFGDPCMVIDYIAHKAE